MSRLIRILMFLCILLMGSSANAGEIARFTTQYNEAYASWRWALHHTGRGDGPAAERALGDFVTRWSVLMDRYKAPPPHFSEEERWGDTLGDTRKMAQRAQDAVRKKDFRTAHGLLEDIRYLLSELRRRNGVITLSDHMNAYYDKLEEILNGPYTADRLDSVRLLELQEQLAVLTHIAEAFGRAGPQSETPPYQTLVDGVFQSIEAVREAIDTGEARKIERALWGLRAPFERLFLDFG